MSLEAGAGRQADKRHDQGRCDLEGLGRDQAEAAPATLPTGCPRDRTTGRGHERRAVVRSRVVDPALANDRSRRMVGVVNSEEDARDLVARGVSFQAPSIG